MSGRWMVGVFRERLHWVDAEARVCEHAHGTTFYAVCNAPCLTAPQGHYDFWRWPPCLTCFDLAESAPPRPH